MPAFVVGARAVQVERLSLDIPDAAEVLGTSEAVVRRMVARGLLKDVGVARPFRLDPAEILSLVPDRPLAQGLLAALLAEDRVAADRYRSLIGSGGPRDH